MFPFACRLVALLFFLSPALSFSEDTAFLVGMLRSDGVITPFACHDGSRWDTPWPEAGASVDTSRHDLNALPKEWYAPLPSVPREWYIRTTSGGFRAVEVEQAVYASSTGTTTAAGLRSGYIGAKSTRSTGRQPGIVSARRSEPGMPPEGIALSRNVQTRAVSTVGKESAEWRILFAAIREAFSEAEDKRGHPLPQETREREELAVLSLYRGAPEPDGSVLYRFETARNYVASALLPGTSPAGCARFRGWIRLDRTGSPSFLKTDFSLERFVAPLAPTLTPLGVISFGSGSFWVAVERNRGNESYVILEAGRTEVRTVVRTFGGGY